MVSNFPPVNLNNDQRWPHPPKPNLIGYFARSAYFARRRSEYYFEENALDLLNYYNKQVDWSDLGTYPAALQSRLSTKFRFLDGPIKKWILLHSELEAVKRAKFVADSVTLVDILNIPTVPKHEWAFRVEKRNEKYYLSHESSEFFSSSTAENLCLFHKCNSLPSVFRSETEDFFEVYEVEVGEHHILYAASLDGVKSDRRVTNLDELKAATHLYTTFCNRMDHQLVSCVECSRKWTRAALISAGQVLAVNRRRRSTESPFGLQYQVQETTVDQLIAKQNELGTSEGLNLPYTAWNYLHDLLTLLERHISRFPVLQDRSFKVIHDDNNLVFILHESTGMNWC